jgi:hypothetical protein
MSEKTDVIPIDYLRTAIAGWKIMLSIAIFFSVLGIGLSSLLPPQYQASAILQVDIDYVRAAPLDDVTVMKAYEKVRGVLLADDVLSGALLAVEKVVGSTGELTGIAAMRDRIRLSQRPDGWELVVYSQDPTFAAGLADAWAEASIRALEEGLHHSLLAWEWQNALYSAHCSLSPDPQDETRALWQCSTRSEGLDPAQIPEAILEQVRLSRGILPMFSFSILQHAAVPDSPILWGRAPIILIGSLLGLLLGFIWTIGRQRQETQDP